MNGSIKLALTPTKYYKVWGGPYREIPPSFYGVKMAAEIKMDCAVNIPTRDYSVPPVATATEGLIKTVELILSGQPVYVGCMGGIGRTGLMLALLLKAFGAEDPVREVRAQYLSHAVETADQKAYVSNFAIPKKVKRMIRWARLRMFFSRKGNLTTSHSAL